MIKSLMYDVYRDFFLPSEKRVHFLGPKKDPQENPITTMSCHVSEGFSVEIGSLSWYLPWVL